MSWASVGANYIVHGSHKGVSMKCQWKESYCHVYFVCSFSVCLCSIPLECMNVWWFLTSRIDIRKCEMYDLRFSPIRKVCTGAGTDIAVAVDVQVGVPINDV